MKQKTKLPHWVGMLVFIFIGNSELQARSFTTDINPNQFKGTDTERIHAAIKAASGTTDKVVIAFNESRGNTLWKIDEAILLPSGMTVVLDNCTVQLSDQCRDNLFRSGNAGIGVADPQWSKDISIIGVGKATLKGADNPRATGDGARKLTLDPDMERSKGNWRVSYGSDAARPDEKQTGDWRNIMVLIAKVKGFRLHNVNVEDSHAWAISFERTHNAEISAIRIHNPEEITVGNRKVKVFNKDGIDLRQGCKNFRIHNVSGFTGDDFIALSSLDTNPAGHINGTLSSTMVTMSKWNGPEDDIEQIFISNITCESICRGVAIRASDNAGIHHVYIDGLVSREIPGDGGRHNALLLGGKGYGKMSQPGKINTIQVMNIMTTGDAAIMIEAPVANCHFMNILYSGRAEQVIHYAMDKREMGIITETNLKKID